MSATYTDRHIQALTVAAVELNDDGSGYLTGSTGWTSYTPASVLSRLDVGAAYELETRGFSRVTGWRIDGEWVERKSDADLEREHAEMVAGFARQRREQLDRNRDEWTRRSAELPSWARDRLAHFQERGGEKFELDGWGYELTVCELAVMYAADSLADTERINAYASREGTTGNQHDCAKALARAHLNGASLAGTVAALAPLTGDADYSGGAK